VGACSAILGVSYPARHLGRGEETNRILIGLGFRRAAPPPLFYFSRGVILPKLGGQFARCILNCFASRRALRSLGRCWFFCGRFARFRGRLLSMLAQRDWLQALQATTLVSDFVRCNFLSRRW